MLAYFIIALVFFAGGFTTGFFVMRNNPKYFNIDKMTKDKLRELKKDIEERL